MVFILAAGIARAAHFPKPSLVAILACALWILSPFLAAAQLTLIQRMTTLAGLWVFFGLALYVWGRIQEPRRPFIGLSMIAVGLFVGTSLGTLSKENAALLPLLALVTEITLLNRNLKPSPHAVAIVRWVILILPSAAILAYIATRVPSLLDPISQHREYTPLQRLASQTQILWEYVGHLLLPTTSSVTPFNDDRVAAEGWLTLPVLASTLSWLVVFVAAFLLRHRAPVLLFSVCFFLAGHLLESGVIHLELYYPHRNYVPAFGLYFMIAALMVYATHWRLRIVAFASIAYVVAFAMILGATTSLWGQPLLAAEMWSKQHTESNRANQFLASAYYSVGDHDTAHWVLRQAATVDRSGVSAIQVLHTCAFHEDPPTEVAQQVAIANELVQRGTHNQGIGTIVLAVTVRALEGHCPYLNHQLLRHMIDTVLTHPNYAQSRPIRAQLSNAKALIALSEGNTEAHLYYVKEMYNTTKHINHARFYARVLATEGQTDAAVSFLERAREDGVSHVVKRWIRSRMIDEEIMLINQSANEAGARL
jgi:protein O-mannosyl-transferase